MRIIPAIDIIEGQCVRLTQGDYSQKKIYHSNPLEVAKEFEDNGIKYLHLVDLDGAKSNEIVNWKTLEKICNETNLKVDFGGGIKTNEAIKLAFECGASQITGGSIAVKNEKLFSEWINIFGASKIILGADVKDEKIAVGGWLAEVLGANTALWLGKKQHVKPYLRCSPKLPSPYAFSRDDNES